MRQLLDAITRRLQGFVAQRENLALVLVGQAGADAPLLKILEGIETETVSDLFWTFTDNFVDSETYAESIISAFSTKHFLVTEALEKEGLKPWPAIPPEIASAETPPVERLRRLVAFTRELIPVRYGGNSVCIFYPLEIQDPLAYRTLVGGIFQHDFPFPWCHHIRFIFRDEPGADFPLLAGAPRVERYAPDLGIDAITRAMEEEVANDALPLEQRLAYLPIMAGTDFAYSRYEEALDKYGLLLQYHAPSGNLSMAAFALNGMGEVYERMDDLERANECFESALIPATQAEPAAVNVLLNTVLNLGHVCTRQSRWSDGEAYYDVAHQLATVARDPTTKITSLERRGICQQQQGRHEEAASSWHDGSVIAAQLQDVGSCRTLLSHLEHHYTAIGDEQKAREIQEQLAGLNSPNQETT